jgi:hypothetical protein
MTSKHVKRRVYEFFSMKRHVDARLGSDQKICPCCEGRIIMRRTDSLLWGRCESCKMTYILVEV